MGVTSVTSESLQLKLRQLLPSQQGFGTDLSASDTIIPIIDLTESAEGSNVRPDLQMAFAFGSQSNFNVSNGTTTVINNTGFWRIFGTVSLTANGSGPEEAKIIVADASTDQVMWQANTVANTGAPNQIIPIDFLVFLAAGESVKMLSSNPEVFLTGSFRQIADVNGNLQNPAGFNPQ